MALGKPHVQLNATFETKIPNNCNSTVAQSRNMPDPSYDITLPSGNSGNTYVMGFINERS